MEIAASGAWAKWNIFLYNALLNIADFGALDAIIWEGEPEINFILGDEGRQGRFFRGGVSIYIYILV